MVTLLLRFLIPFSGFSVEYFSSRELLHVIYAVVLYGCETFLTLREKCRLNIFENRTLRLVFGPKRYANGE
jgi:hypothetical protein